MAGAELHLLDLTKTHEGLEDVPGWEKEEAVHKKLYDENLAKDELKGWDG